jgi:hypothetical protein
LLTHQLRQFYRKAIRTLSSLLSWSDRVCRHWVVVRLKRNCRVSNVALMIGTIQIHTIPARWKSNGCPDPTSAEVIWQSRSIVASTWSSTKGCEVISFEATVADPTRFACCTAEGRVASKHTETLVHCQKIVPSCVEKSLTGLKAVTLVTPS